jgi:hypothetical protein
MRHVIYAAKTVSPAWGKAWQRLVQQLNRGVSGQDRISYKEELDEWRQKSVNAVVSGPEHRQAEWKSQFQSKET